MEPVALRFAAGSSLQSARMLAAKYFGSRHCVGQLRRPEPAKVPPRPECYEKLSRRFMSTFIARQPILDRTRQVVGYELLYRASNTSHAFDAVDGNMATAQVISDTLWGVGLGRITNGRPAFINFTEEMLTHDPNFVVLFTPDSLVVEILETVEPTDSVVRACKNIKASGYRLAMDDYRDGARFQPLLACADIVKIDIRAAPLASPHKLVSNFHGSLKALAEKVESYEEFDQARRLGYSYFQGYFFARPSLVESKRPTSTRFHAYALLEAIQSPQLDYHKLSEVIRRDVSFTCRILRYVNSALFGHHGTIDSIIQCLLLLGDTEIRRWASLAVLSSLGDKKPRELLVLALVRARFCELLGGGVECAPSKSCLFLMGMFSLLDAITDQPMSEAISGLPLDSGVIAVLLGSGTSDPKLAAVLDLVCFYESADWGRAQETAFRLAVPNEKLTQMYASAVQWAEDAFRVH